MFQNQHYSPENMDSLKAQDNNTVVPANNKSPLLEGGHSIKMVPCRLSNMISSHQDSINYLLKHNSKEILLWHLRISKTTSRRVSMQQIDPKNTPFLLTSPFKNHSEFQEYYVPDCYNLFYY